MMGTFLYAAPFILLSVFFFVLYRKKVHELAEFRNINVKLHRVSGVEGILSVIRTEIELKGGKVLAMYKLNRGAQQLETEDAFVSLFVRNSVAKALLTMKAQHLNIDSEADKDLGRLYGGEASFIPVSLGREKECWELHDCGMIDKCDMYGKIGEKCWLSADVVCRGRNFNSYREKLASCLTCRSFLPLCVFVVKAGSPGPISRYVNDTFGGFLRNSVQLDKAMFSATRDPLTNILNKRGLLNNLAFSVKLCRRQPDIQMSLCMFDIDHFKNFNDSFGHQEGDKLLKELAGLMVSLARESDTVARYGGEEFCIILPHTDRDGALIFAEKLRKAVEENVFCGSRKITISLGLASFSQDEVEDEDDFISKADMALYYSKNTRNTATAYEKGMSMKGEPKAPKKSNGRKKAKAAVTTFKAQEDTAEEEFGEFS